MKRVAFFRDLFALSNRRRQLNRKSQNFGRSATLEQLELRQVLTGNVTAQVSAGSLIVFGDDAGNAIELARSGSNLVLRGLDSTTINGQSTEFIVRGGTSEVERSLFAYLNGGNDTFSIGDGVTVRRDAFVYLGEGNDTFAMQGSNAQRGLLVDMGNGNDNISLLHAFVHRDATFLGASGNKTVSISDSYLGNHFTLITTSGSDAVLIDNSHIDDDAYINTGVGNDDIVIGDSSFQETAAFDTSLGDDAVKMDPGSSYNDTVVVALGDGNDSLLAVGGNQFDDAVFFIGQTGTDSIDTSGSNSFNDGVRSFDADQSSVDQTALDARLNASGTGALARATALQSALETLITLPVLTVQSSATTIAENATTTLTGTVTRPTASFGAVEVSLSSSDTTEATVPVTVTIPAGKTSVTFAITPANDSILDGTQTVTITAKAVGYTAGTSSSISVTDDEQPSLSLSFASSSISEVSPGNITTGTVTRPIGSTSGALTVTVSNSDRTQATAPTTVTIPDGQTSATFDLTAVNDTLSDGSKLVSITVSATGFTNNSASVSIADDETSQILSLTFNPASFAESAGATATTGTVSRTGDTTAALTVTLTSSDTTEATVPATVTIPAGQSSITFAIAAVEDTTADGTQTVAITASATGFTSDSENVSVTDNDIIGALSLSFNPTSFSEGATGTASTGTVARTGDTSAAATVTLTSGDNSEIAIPSTVTIPAGQTSVTFIVSAVEDTAVDGSQTVSVTASATGLTSDTESVTVTDNDTAPALSLSFSHTSFIESAGATGTTGTVSRTGDTSSDLTVTLSSDDTTEATVPPSVTIAAGQLSATFAVAAVEDTTVDGPQTVAITASATGLTSDTKNVTVTDNDGAELSLLLIPTSVSESAGSNASTGTISRNSDTSAELIVTLVSSVTSAATVPASVTIPAGETAVTFPINAVNDDIADGQQMTTITATATGFSPVTQDLNVTDDEGAAALTVTLDPASVSEGAGSTASTGTVRRNTATTDALTVTLNSSLTTAATVPSEVIIPAGASSATFAIAAINNNIENATQSVTITASATGLDSDAATLSVTDDDELPTLTVTLAASTVSEASGSNVTSATIERTGTDLTNALTVALASSDTSEATVPATAVIPAGQSSVTVDVTGVDDLFADGTKSVTLTATSTGFVDGTAALSVTDNDGPAALTVSLQPASVDETGGTAASVGTVSRNTEPTGSLLVTLSNNLSGNVSTPATVTIPAGESSVTFNIDITNDTAVTGQRAVTIAAIAGSHADGSATLQLTDDDAPDLTISVNPSDVSEDDGSGATTGTVSRPSNSTSGALVVTLSSNNTGKVTVPATVTIPDGQSSVTFDIDTVDNSIADGAKTVSVTASASGFNTHSTDIEVADDDGPKTVTVTIAPTTIAENSSTGLTGTLSRNTDTTEALVVNLTSTDTSELSVPATVQIPAGQSSVTFSISTIDDFFADGTKSVTIVPSASGFVGHSDSLDVTDNEPAAAIELSLSPTSIVESDSDNAIAAKVTRNTETDVPLVVTLNSTIAAAFNLPDTVTIPVNADSVSFSVGTIDDNAVFTPTRKATITATAGELTSSVDVSILENDKPTFVVTLGNSSVLETGGNAVTTATISRPTGSEIGDVTVTLTSSDTTEATLPATVLIPAGQLSVTVDINAVDDSVADGKQSVTITASQSNFNSGTAVLTVLDNELALELDTPTTNVAQVGSDLITKTAAFKLSGQSEPNASVLLDIDGDGFDDGSVTANSNGDFSFSTTLTHTATNQGDNTFRVQATSDTSAVVATRELTIHYAVGSVVEFQSTRGDYAVELFDTDAPLTVANFKSYLSSFSDSIVHRSVSDFVIQGGGFLIANDGSISANPEHNPVDSEFTGQHSNVRGTIAMALFGTDANSGTNQWFINVADNSGLDASHFTVFGQVIGDGMSVVDVINALPGVNLEVQTGEGALGEVPVIGNLSFESIDGTVSINQGSRVLTGVGTTFTLDLVDSVGGAPGSTIRVGGELFTISSILNDTSALVAVAASTAHTNATIERHATPGKESYVVFSSIGEILNGGT